MSLTLLIVFITAVLAGLGFWFYNRRQINSLTETIEDKNAVINSFREHLAPPVEEVESLPNVRFTTDKIVVDMRPEKKKQRYNNRPKKNSSEQKSSQPNQQPQQNSEKKNRPKPRKPKTQQ